MGHSFAGINYFGIFVGRNKYCEKHYRMYRMWGEAMIINEIEEALADIGWQMFN